MKHALLGSAAAILLVSLAATAADNDQAPRPDDVKAVFIYKFTGYVTWPEDDANSFTIAVLGESSMLAPLRQIAAKRPVDSRPIVVKQCSRVDEIAGAHILLIADSMKDQLDAVIEKARTEKILTVGSTPGFAERGVAMNFVSKNGRVGFEMNLDALKKNGLCVSSQLVKLATLVETDSQAGAEGSPQ